MELCWSKGLISEDEYEDIMSSVEADRRKVAQLLRCLRRTGDDGFVKFKAILSRWPLPQGTAHALSDIEKKEMEIYGNKVRTMAAKYRRSAGDLSFMIFEDTEGRLC